MQKTTIYRKPMEITQKVKKGTAEYEIVEYSFYNADTDKLERTDIQFNGAAPNSKVSEFVYDELGRIEMRKNSNGIYETSYGYNVRGNMTEMASESLLEDCTIFREQLGYTTSVGSGTPNYNGNISSMTWKAYGDNVYRNYNFEYDGLNRMTAACYGEGASPYNVTATNGYQELITYNANSSPVGLIRYGRTNTNVMGVIDNLAYEYNGNQLASINDGSGVSLIYRGYFDFKDKTQDASEYEYDSNGNMTKDSNKGIKKITYDDLGHPVRITFPNGSRTEYVYSPDGTKLRASYLSPVNNLEADQTMILNNVHINSIAAVNSASLPISSPTNTSTTLPAISTSFSPTTLVTENPELLMSTSATEYLGNFIFENGRLDKVLFDGGYIKINSFNVASYHYYFTDHLGSVRVVGDGGGDVEQVNHYYPYGGLIGNLSTNPDKQKYKYNGKEYDTMHGLNTYDYGARQYDGTKIVWDRMDKYCEKKPWNNPYIFCGGNPVSRIDPDGRDWVEGADGNIVWRNSVVSSNYQKVLNSGEMYRGVDYIRYKNWNNSRAVGLVQEHYLPNKTLSYEVHKGTYQFDFTGEVISSQELTGKQLSSNHAAKGIRGTAYLNAVFSDGNTYTTETYPFTSGPYGNGPTPNHNYIGSDFAYTSQAGMTIGGDRGWKVYLEDFNGRMGLRMHPDTNSPETAGCIGIQGSAEALANLGSFLHDYIKTQNKNIQINFIITGNPNYGNNGKANPNIGQ